MKSHILILGIFLFICECKAQKVNISCAFNWTDQASQYVNSTFCCTVNAPLKIDHENIEIEKMQRSFTCFVADQKEIFFFPRGLHSYVDNLQVINITNSKLTEIKADDIKTWKDLTVLDLSGNELTILETDTFSYNTKLTCLNLNYNKIYYVAKYTFTRLPSVRYLDFQHNICDSRLLINHSEVQTGKKMIENECSLSKSEENILKMHEHQREQSVNRTRIEYESFKKEILRIIGDVNKSVSEIVLPIIGSSMGDYLSNLFSQNDTNSGNAVIDGRALSTKKQILNELNGIVDKNIQNYLKSMEIDQHKQKIRNLEKRLNDTKNELNKKLSSNHSSSLFITATITHIFIICISICLMFFFSQRLSLMSTKSNITKEREKYENTEEILLREFASPNILPVSNSQDAEDNIEWIYEDTSNINIHYPSEYNNNGHFYETVT